ncbi:hypothetical protein FSP39_005600 [Pinctada imbricata]|uniref:Uncharacterized protein n=1 Tax=Pinctada imbricata TaxID=66713 RepID=A0AA88Y7Q3_PINIB|nr:hypothetical protein FSP39_005600 [Pinctada imbricata]
MNDYSRKSSVTEMMRQLQWTPLSERRRMQRLTFFFKIMNDLVAVPADSMHIFKNNRSQRQSHSQKKKAVQVISTSTNVYKNSFTPKTILDWNSLPEALINSRKPEEFKAALQDTH